MASADADYTEAWVLGKADCGYGDYKGWRPSQRAAQCL